MNAGKAIAIAPLATFPVVLAFLLLWSFIGGHRHELPAVPVGAVVVTAGGYPFMLAAVWLAWRTMTRFGLENRAGFLVTAVVFIEAFFWLAISPFGKRGLSGTFYAAMVGACGLACGATFLRPTHRPSKSHEARSDDGR